MDRLKAAAVVVGVEERELLAAVDPVLGVVDIEHDAPGDLFEAVAEHFDHRGHHAFQRDGAGQVLQPADGRLRAQIAPLSGSRTTAILNAGSDLSRSQSLPSG